MFWIPLAMAGMSLLQSKKQNDEIKVQNKINKSNTKIANMQQQANSTISAAQGALSRATQSLQTREVQREYGLEYNKLETERAQLSEQMAKGSFASRVNASAQQGALQARASAAGIGGSTVDMLSVTMDLQQQMEQRDLQDAYSDNLFSLDQAEQENVYGQLGIIQQQNVYLDNVAAAQIVGPAKIPKISTGSMLLNAGMAALSSASSVGGEGGINSFFNTAQKGAAAGVKTIQSWFSGGAKGA